MTASPRPRTQTPESWPVQQQQQQQQQPGAWGCWWSQAGVLTQPGAASSLWVPEDSRLERRIAPTLLGHYTSQTLGDRLCDEKPVMKMSASSGSWR